MPRDESPAVIEAFRRGVETWPGVALAFEAFADHVQAVNTAAQELARFGADLYLACGCASGDTAALALFERQLLPAIDRSVAQMGLGPDLVQEVRQILRMRLFVDQRKIRSYRGRSSLLQWLRTVSMRIAFEVLEEGKRSLRDDREALDRLVASSGDTELSFTRRTFHQRFQSALDETFAQLPARSKALLRMHYLDGLNLDAMALVYRVHRATVARWLLAIRSAVVGGIRERLCLAVNPTSSDFRSLAAALRGDLEVRLEGSAQDGRGLSQDGV